MDMALWNSPGLDGFPTGFYHISWQIVRGNVSNYIRDLWHMVADISEVNSIDLCLIPKVESPQTVHQFRPISLCNSIYKVLSKIMLNRLRHYMGMIVTPNQIGFIPKRYIQENIVVAHEVLHSMHKIEGKQGYFSIKVNLDKAYYNVSQNFVDQVLKEVGVPIQLFELVTEQLL